MRQLWGNIETTLEHFRDKFWKLCDNFWTTLTTLGPQGNYLATISEAHHFFSFKGNVGSLQSPLMKFGQDFESESEPLC